MNSLGNTLKKVRKLRSLSLNEVKNITGISKAYLSQLENNKIPKPSVYFILKLTQAYKININTLLTQQPTKKDKWINQLILYTEDLNEEQKKEILNFAKFISSKTTNSKPDET